MSEMAAAPAPAPEWMWLFMGGDTSSLGLAGFVAPTGSPSSFQISTEVAKSYVVGFTQLPEKQTELMATQFFVDSWMSSVNAPTAGVNTVFSFGLNGKRTELTGRVTRLAYNADKTELIFSGDVFLISRYTDPVTLDSSLYKGLQVLQAFMGDGVVPSSSS